MMLSTRRRAAFATAAALVPLGAGALLVTATATPASAATNLLTNPGFETGSTSGWSCSSTDSVVSSPAHSGSHALAAAASSSDDAQCTQTVSVTANTTYTLSGYVEGAYAYIGVSGSASSSNWTPSATGWQQLTDTFTTGSSTSLTVFLHGWYGQGTVYFDDMSLVGGSTAPTTQPTTTPPPTTTGGGGTTGPGGGSGNYAFAPYVDMSNNQEPMLSKAVSGGLKAFTAAFVIGSGCTPIWGDTLPVTNDPTINGEISAAESGGASAIVSFGGAGGVELAESCTTLSSLEAAYQSVISTLGVNHIDFDIEGAAIAYTADNDLRFQAIKELESANPGLVVSVTLPVLPTGLTSDGTTFLAAAKTYGVTLNVINVMTMDYGSSFDSGINMATAAEQAAAATLAQARADWPSDTYANIGITPMIGVNDDSAEVFSLANASSLVSWAKSNGIGRLAFWSVDRDQPCSGSVSGLPACSEISQSSLQFTQIFEAF